MGTNTNIVVLVGRLTRDAELRYTQSGTAVSNLTIACNEAMKQSDGTWRDEGHFFDLTLWGKRAEALDQYLLKGRQIAIQGRLKLQRWTDNATGGNKSKIVINIETLELLSAPVNQGNQQQSDIPQNRSQQPPHQSYQQNGNNYQQRPPAPKQGHLYEPKQNGFDPPNGPRGFAGPESFDDDIPF